MTVALRVVERTDLPFVHGLFNDPDIMRYWFSEPHVSLAAGEDALDKYIRDEHRRSFIIDDDGDAVGLVELVYIDFIHRKCEFQIIVAPAAQGNGYAGRATGQAIDYAFAHLNLNKVVLHVDVENEKAAHVYERAGFVDEAVLREEYFAGGAYHDVRVMRVLRSEYAAS